ncbi:hypothetical protein TNCT_317811 [Trichonephila clavata]|uniref:Uncharacterized protein n=1 Tax=Trichonephila clavata TaxID=2740835 RepID=A0A8X6EZI1_TRICU|nr:hypothetical protein TNCT_317811 [Trichonephila clavata]
MKLIEDFNEIPSLGLLTAIQIVVAVWNRGDISCSISKCLSLNDAKAINEKWRNIFLRVQEIVRGIEIIPPELLANMDAIVLSVGSHVRESRTFVSFSPYFNYADDQFPVNHWTLYGTVDTKRVNEQLAQDERRCIYYRYNSACTGCFEKIIIELFPELSEFYKIFEKVYEGRELINYWIRRLSSEYFDDVFSFDEVNSQQCKYSPHQYAFQSTLKNASKSGIEYFLNYLSPNEYEYVLDNAVCFFADRVGPSYCLPPSNEQYTDSLYFLMSNLDDNQRMKILRRNTFRVLSSFLRYPFFGLFNKYAGLLVDDLKWNEIRLLLYRIFYLEERNTHFFGLDLFKDLWHSCSKQTQSYIIYIENACISDESNESLRFLERIKKT